MTSFETSTEAKQQARWTDVINAEISAIEECISEAVEQGKFTTVVSDTPMTTPYRLCHCHPDGDGYTENYRYEFYDVWKQRIENMPCQDAMNQVIKYFTDKKFTISRQTNPYTRRSFFWIISWS